MPLWDTLYRWLCHHGTPYVDRYIIKEHPMYMLFHCGGMIFKVPYTSLKAPGDYIYSIVGHPVFLCVVKDGISISMLFKNHTITKLKELRSLVFSCYDCFGIFKKWIGIKVKHRNDNHCTVKIPPVLYFIYLSMY